MITLVLHQHILLHYILGLVIRILVIIPVIKCRIYPLAYHKDFALGRKSTEALIPKSTSAVSALGKVLPDLAAKISSYSYRVPTPIVSSALLTFNVYKGTKH